MHDPDEIIKLLNLKPLEPEGGYFSETYRSPLMFSESDLEDTHGGSRNSCTAIYYMLTPDTYSAMHRVKSDEIFHFYLGDPVEMLWLSEGEAGRTLELGSDLEQGMQLQVVVPAGVWQGTRLKPGGRFALMGCTVSPGFDYADYEHGDRDQLIEAFPNWSEFIRSQTSEH